MNESLGSPPGPRKILVVEDNRSQLDTIVYTLSDHGIDEASGTPVLTATNGREALGILDAEGGAIAVVLTDLKMPGTPDGIGLLGETVKRVPRARRILATAYAGELTLDEAINSGRINALLEKGYRPEDLVATVREALEDYDELDRVIRENAALRESGTSTQVLDGLIGSSGFLAELKAQVARVAAVDSHVLVMGETGTGKELVARAIHDLSVRRDAPFVAVNCSAVPETLLEGEFFGTRKGAYSGAMDRRGLIEAAAGGSLLLDELGKAPVAIQSKLLRFLGEGCFLPVGAREEIRADVRIIATANEDLESAMQEGRFLKDLYYRLRGCQLRVLPLRERREDVPLLARHFLLGFNRDYGRAVLGFTEAATAAMRVHDWPGNVRELEETIRDAVVRRTDDGCFVEAEELELGRERERVDDTGGGGLEESVHGCLDGGSTLQDVRNEVERIALTKALEDANWVIEAAAKRLGVSRPWVYDRLARFGLERP